MKKEQGSGIAGPSLYGVKIKLLDKNEDSSWTVGHISSSAESRGSTIVIIKIKIYSTTTSSGEGRSEYTPATSTHYSHGLFSHSVGGSQYSLCVGHIPNPALPPYNLESPNCMAPRRWRIHSSAGRLLLREEKVTIEKKTESYKSLSL